MRLLQQPASDGFALGLQELAPPFFWNCAPRSSKAYRPETKVAKTFQPRVMPGRPDARMDDFHDPWHLSDIGASSFDRLALAVALTFERRRTRLPGAFGPAFATAPAERG